MRFGTKKAAKAIFGAVKKTGEVIGDAVDPAKIAARAADEITDTFKDDELIVDGESRLVIFGKEVGRITHLLRVYVADKE